MPSAGPTTRATLKTREFSATAFIRSSRPTMSMTNASRAGVSIALTTPIKNAAAKRATGVTKPTATMTASAIANRSNAACARKMRERRGSRSARLPLHTPRRNVGTTCAAVTLAGRLELVVRV